MISTNGFTGPSWDRRAPKIQLFLAVNFFIFLFFWRGNVGLSDNHYMIKIGSDKTREQNLILQTPFWASVSELVN